MLGTGGRWLPVVLPLLLMVRVDTALAQSGGNDPTAKTDPKPAVRKTLGLAGAFGPVASHLGFDSQRVVPGLFTPACPVYDGASSSSSYRHAVPEVPEPFSMALVGSVCIALVHDSHHGRHGQAPCFSAVIPLSGSQIPTCISLYQQAMRELNDRRGMNAARAIAPPPRVSDLLEPRPASIANPRVFLSSLIEFAQLGRGPPPVS